MAPQQKNMRGRIFRKQDESHVMRKELEQLPGNLKAPWHLITNPIHTLSSSGRYEKQRSDEVKKALAKYNICLLGRFAEWEYYNMDKCIESAMAV
jgi:UDP-galactopyranose mutase